MALGEYLAGAIIGGALVGGIVYLRPFDTGTRTDREIIFSNYRYYDNKSSDDGWIEINGSLNNPNIPDNDPHQPSNNSYTINCTQSNMACSVASIQQSDKNTADKITLTSFTIASWKSDRVVATRYAGNPVACEKVTIDINRNKGKTYYMSEPFNVKDTTCAMAGIKKVRQTIEDSRGWRYLTKSKEGGIFTVKL